MGKVVRSGAGVSASQLVPPPEPGAAGVDLEGARALVPLVLGWLQQRDPAPILRTLAGWPPDEHLALRRFLTAQGVGPLVAAILEAPAGAGVAPGAAETVEWLALQLAQNRARARAFQDDLSAILAGAGALGVPVMPLKGGLLAATLYKEPGLRPMADLDLLVRPADEAGMRALLGRLGYGLLPETEAAVRHRTFLRPTDLIVSTDGTHPGNPRRVELHARLLRSVWLDHGGVEMGAYLWDSGREGTLLGQPARLPSPAALVTDVAAHATNHLLGGTGMLLHWYDVVGLANEVERLEEAFADWSYPALALAARAFPDGALAAKVARLRPSVAPSLAALAARVPLDDRAGLNVRGVNPTLLPWLAERWRRWGPTPWVVRLAYPGAPLPLAYPAYVGGVAARAARKAVRSTLADARKAVLAARAGGR